MNRLEYLDLLGQKSTLERMIAETPEEDVIDRGSLGARLEEIQELLANLKPDQLEIEGTESRLRAQHAWANWDEAEVERELSSWKKQLL